MIRVRLSMRVLTLGSAVATLLVFSNVQAGEVEERASGTRESTGGANSQITQFQKQIETLSQSIQDLQRKLSQAELRINQLERQVSDLRRQVAAGPATGSTAPTSSTGREALQGVSDRQSFKQDVLKVVNPELSKLRDKLNELEGVAKSYSQHHHTYSAVSKGYANLETLSKHCDGCLIPFVGLQNQGKSLEVSTSGPK